MRLTERRLLLAVLAWVLATVIAGSVASCGEAYRPPPNLNPEATAAWHVNSEKTKLVSEAVAYQQQIALQRETIDELKKATALLAQAKALADMAQAVSVPTASATPAAAPVLRDIEQNTKATAENTTRASAVVAEVKDAVDLLKDK